MGDIRVTIENIEHSQVIIGNNNIINILPSSESLFSTIRFNLPPSQVFNSMAYAIGVTTGLVTMYQKKFNALDLANHYRYDKFPLVEETGMATVTEGLVSDPSTGGCKYGYIIGSCKGTSPGLEILLEINLITPNNSGKGIIQRVLEILSHLQNITDNEKIKLKSIWRALSNRYVTGSVKQMFYLLLIDDI